MIRTSPQMHTHYCATGNHHIRGKQMENYLLYPFSQTGDLSITPSIAFDACGFCRVDAAAEQHLQRLVARNVSVSGSSVLPALLEIPRERTGK